MAGTPDPTALNARQRQAVEHREGPLLVIAGPGTGKTRVITERIRHLLESETDLPGAAILGLTFTEKAAGEMMSRVKNAVGQDRAAGTTLSTFHSFCYEKILREVNPTLEVLDEIDHWVLLRRNMAELRLVHYKKLGDLGQFLTDFVKFFSRCQDSLVTPADYETYVANQRADFESRKAALDPAALREEEVEIGKQEEVARVYRISEELQRRGNLVTYGGQILQAVHLLGQDQELRRQWQQRYRYILVDEFQDTNIAQLELLWLLASGHRNIFVVGDHNQAIYRFRGASFGSFSIFARRFCGLQLDDERIEQRLVKLGRNYRSTPNILRVAQQLILQNEQPKERLWSYRLETHKSEGVRIRIAEFPAPESEAAWVAGEIEKRHAAGEEWRNFAVLYRKHANRHALVDTLRARRVPFVIRKFSILTNTLFRDLLAYLRLIAVPSDNVACSRVLAMPWWNLQPSDLVRLAERAGRNPLYREMAGGTAELPFEGEPRRTAEMIGLVEELRGKSRKLAASQIFDRLVESLGLAPLPAEADALVLERFRQFVRDWERKNERFGGKSLKEFIEYFDYFQQASGEIYLEKEPEHDAVQLMTVHAAKGLEFRHVFVIRLASGDFPTRPRRPVLEFPVALMKEEAPRDFQVQEERRLFYVAVTRAQQSLTLTTVVNNRKKPSPFLEDVLLDKTLREHDTLRLSPKPPLSRPQIAAGPHARDASQPRLFGPAAACPRLYSRIALWSRAYRPPVPEPLRLSATSIDIYESCALKYLFGEAWGIRGGPAAKMTFGRVMHGAIRELSSSLRNGHRMPLDELLAVYDREWPARAPAAGFLDDYEEQEYRQAGREQLTAFYRSHTAAPPQVAAVEKTFELPLPGGIVVAGRLDQVNRLAHGAVEIVDYKTGRPRTEKDAEKSLQLSLYAMAARDVLEMEPERLTFYNLTSNEAVSAARDAKALKQAEKKVLEVAGMIRAREFPPNPGWACRNCEFRPICPEHEQLVTLPAARNKESAVP
jgi:ATP-dependent DNA helicase UvrD/PcrA